MLRYVVAVLLLFASLGVLGGWWMVHRALPQLDGSISLPGLKQDVIVDRDGYGVPTIRTGSMEDLLRAQGYVTAQDRMWQMDLLRRAAAGELSEIFGSTTLALDREMRVLGLRQAAEAALATLDAQTRQALEAYAAGVNRYLEDHKGKLPGEFLVLGYRPRSWSPTDSLLLHAYMYNVLTSTWRWELNRARVLERVGPELVRELFVSESPHDHFVVGGQALPARVVLEKAAAAPSRVTTSIGPPTAGDILADLAAETERVLGSNNWVVDGQHTYSGKPLLANDTHFENDAPSIWYMVHLKAPGYNVKGFALPGGPLVVIGHNERIAWGFTNNGADVQDLYIEQFNPQNMREYRVNGKWTAATVRKETLRVKGARDYLMDVVVTRHGPIVEWDRKNHRGYALKWVATEPVGLGAGYSFLGAAQNWQEFLGALRGVSGPAQNAVYADVDGNIGFVVAAKIPVRRNGDGSVPMPGDSDEHEWIGYIPFEELPKVLNPPGGVIATANARVVGPRYRRYLTDRWYSPYRTDSIYRQLERRAGLRPEQCITIQADTVSPPHAMLAKMLVEASKKVAPKDARVQRLLERLLQWDGRADASSRHMAFVEFTRRELMRAILRTHLGDDWARYQWSRSSVFFENVMTERPARWLPKEYTSYDEFLVASADRAVQELERQVRQRGVARPDDPEQWRWGQFVQLEFLHPLGRAGFLRRHLSMADVDQSGASTSIKQTGRSVGAAMRFVADLSNLDNSLMNITLGQSGHYLSKHYKDQFPAWYAGRGIPSAFSDAAEEKVRRHRLVMSAAR